MSATSSKRERRPRLSSRYESLVLRCFIYPKNGEYYAECVDLDLLVTADTARAAQIGLRDAIEGYLLTVGEHDDHGLVPRPAPWISRMKYKLYSLLALLFRRNFLVFELTPDTVRTI